VTLTGGLSHARANMSDVLALLAGRRIEPGLVASDVLDFDSAAQAIPAAGFKPVLMRDPLTAPATRSGISP
jgi:hypothetical protein